MESRGQDEVRIAVLRRQLDERGVQGTPIEEGIKPSSPGPAPVAAGKEFGCPTERGRAAHQSGHKHCLNAKLHVNTVHFESLHLFDTGHTLYKVSSPFSPPCHTRHQSAM